MGDAARFRSLLKDVVLFWADRIKFPPLDRLFMRLVVGSAKNKACSFVEVLYCESAAPSPPPDVRLSFPKGRLFSKEGIQNINR
jgi:hypothetical protein